MVDPTIDNRVIRSLSASTREKSPRKKRKKKNNPVDIVFTRMPKHGFMKTKPLQMKSQVDLIRETAGNIEKSSRPKSERHLPASGKLGYASPGAEHTARFMKAALRDRLQSGDLDFKQGKGGALRDMPKPGPDQWNVRGINLSKKKETSKNGRHHTGQDEFLSMTRQDSKDKELLFAKFDRTTVDDVLGQFQTGTGIKPRDRRRRNISVYWPTRYE